MYGVVLAAMMTTGTPAPAFGGLFSRRSSQTAGCYGCMGGCAGYSCGGCAGCQGCGGGCHGFLGIRDFFSNVFSMGGCQGCNGGCYGCMGGCSGIGCMGGVPMAMGCMGGMPMGCYGGMVSSSYDMPLGASPMMMGSSMPMGGSMPMDMMHGMNPAPMMQNQPMGQVPYAPYSNPYPQPYGGQTPPPTTNPMPNDLPVGPPPTTGESTTAPNEATVVVTLPADARLYVQGSLITQSGPVRRLRTPPLTGKTNKYTLRMEVERGGKPVEEIQTVELAPGKVTRVHFAEPGSAGSTARINVAVPDNAQLTVEDKAWPTGQRSITTPELAPGATYVYTLKLERTRDGRKETLTRDVSFKAGEVVTVNFETPSAVAAR